MVAEALGLVGEVVGVHADAVAADQAWAVLEKVPLGSGCFEHVAGVDSEAVKNEGELVHKRDVDVALRVFNCLGGFGHFDAWRKVGSGFDDAAVNAVYEFGRLGSASAGNLFNRFKRVDFVAGIDALRAVAAVKIDVEF